MRWTKEFEEKYEAMERELIEQKVTILNLEIALEKLRHEKEAAMEEADARIVEAKKAAEAEIKKEKEKA